MSLKLCENQIDEKRSCCALANKQKDLKSDNYQGSSFDIGEFDPTVGGILSKAPVAINAALFRPYLWESYNPAMLVSGIENLLFLLFSSYLLLRLRVYNFFRLLARNNLLFFSVTFSLFFAYSAEVEWQVIAGDCL